MERRYFTFYRSFADSIFEFDEKTQFELLRAIIKYSLYDEEIKLEGVAKSVWHLIKPILDSSKKNYENGCKGAEYGSLGGRPKTPKKPQENPEKTPTQTPIIKRIKEVEEINNEELKKESEILNNDNGGLISIGNADKSATRNQRPTPEECFEYCKKQGLSTYDFDGQQKSIAQTTAESFFDYYESNGWKVGKNPMKNWKAALNGWIRRDREWSKTHQKTKSDTIAEQLIREHEDELKQKKL